MDGSACFQEGCGNWVLGEVQKLIILTHLHREIRRMQEVGVVVGVVGVRGGCFLPWNGSVGMEIIQMPVLANNPK